MPENKKQHYVPRFYLKEFSNNETGTHLGLLIKNKIKIVREALLKTQAYENYFYGEDGVIESGFSDIEGKVSRILTEIKSIQKLPSKNSDEYFNLWLFTLLQAVRTKQSLNKTNEATNAVFQKLISKDERLKDTAEGFVMHLRNPVQFNLEAAIEGLHIAADLEAKLIINGSSIPFITSDHPVIQYNQFLEKRKHPFYGAGLGMKGLQIFYPLTPQLMLLLYDAKVYKIKNRKRNYIKTYQSSDVNQLNLLQVANSDEVLFFNRDISDFYITQLCQNNNFSDADKIKINESAPRENSDGTFSQTMHVSRQGIKTKLQMSFMQLTDHAKNYVMTGYVVELRDERMRNRENRRGLTRENIHLFQ